MSSCFDIVKCCILPVVISRNPVVITVVIAKYIAFTVKLAQSESFSFKKEVHLILSLKENDSDSDWANFAVNYKFLAITTMITTGLRLITTGKIQQICDVL